MGGKSKFEIELVLHLDPLFIDANLSGTRQPSFMEPKKILYLQTQISMRYHLTAKYFYFEILDY